MRLEQMGVFPWNPWDLPTFGPGAVPPPGARRISHIRQRLPIAMAIIMGVLYVIRAPDGKFAARAE
jgi:hypothetical protein